MASEAYHLQTALHFAYGLPKRPFPVKCCENAAGIPRGGMGSQKRQQKKLFQRCHERFQPKSATTEQLQWLWSVHTAVCGELFWESHSEFWATNELNRLVSTPKNENQKRRNPKNNPEAAGTAEQGKEGTKGPKFNGKIFAGKNRTTYQQQLRLNVVSVACLLHNQNWKIHFCLPRLKIWRILCSKSLGNV